MMGLHVAMSLLIYLVKALAHLKADDCAHIRRMRIKLPAVKRTEPEQRVALGIIAALVLHELHTVQQAA